MKTIAEITILKRLKSSPRIILYGAGCIGQKVAAWLTTNGYTDFCYAVSDKSKNPDQIGEFVVRQIEELLPIKEEATVIVSTLPTLHYDIKQHLDKLGFRNKIFVNDRFLKSIGIAEVNGMFPEKRAAYYARLNYLSQKLCHFFPCKNIVVFESKIDYTDNCRALSEYLEKQLPGKYQIVWIMKEPGKQRRRLNKKTILISRNQLSTIEIIRLNYYISRAKYIFFTHPGWLCSWKPEQKVINLGHGNPLKNAESLGHVADCVLASGENGIQYRKKEYREDIRVEVLGPPRNDWLFAVDTGVLQAYTDSKKYQKVILCLPTYKQYAMDAGTLKKTKYDSKEINEYCLNTIHSEAELRDLNEYLKEKNILLLCKNHYLQKTSKKRNLSHIKYIDNNLLQKNGHDIYQLMAASDALITDFSSIYMDFLLLDRPVGFFCNSIADYTRGFTMEHPEKYMPGMKIHDNNELKEFIADLAIHTDYYKKEREEARNLIFKYQDNQNCRRCAEYFGM
ncbi:MAG: hypothetical protein HFG81_06470 [Dorea sp.]|jgi:Putative glycosyl/glycerophosphate transferases involved in teichoic acid biosynthesis TagF/TagB/EpsJ/RodC|nr:hypothetical protein [Dorea sp.]